MRVLVVDDHTDSRELVLEWARILGHEVVGAGSVAEALAETTRSTFDAIVTDLHLPDGDGADFIRRVRAADRPPRVVIALTGLPPAEPAPFDVVLAKPVDLERLRKLLSA
ncbi:MAG TPA: response regulator [Labilithrix sp.]|jgi:two-component system response regulator PilR (NtrC family)